MTSYLNEPMAARREGERWVLTATMTTVSPLAIGSGKPGPTDVPVLRDAVDGRPLVPGSSLAGVLRAAARRHVGPPAPGALVELFGGTKGDDHGPPSRLVVHDALAEGEGLRTVLRDGVTIDPGSGTAEPGKLFSREAVERGVRFPLRVELALADPDDALVGLLAACLSDLHQGSARLGARTARGLGRVRLEEVRVARYDLTRAEGWLAYLSTPPAGPLDGKPFSTVAEALSAAAPGRDFPPPGSEAAAPAVFRLCLNASTLLVRAAPGGPADPDVVQLRSGGDAVIPGSSLAGVLRARCRRIAYLVDPATADERVDCLFGPRLRGTSDRSALRASRVRVDEAILEGSGAVVVSRTAIDHFSHKVVDGALFDEGISRGGRAAGVEIRIDRPEPSEVGLVALAVRDLLAGTLAVGGTIGVGRGHLSGRARLTAPGHLLDHNQPLSVDLDPAQPVPEIDCLVAALWEEER